MDAKEYLHSDEIDEWNSVFDPEGNQEYTEEQLLDFAEMWAQISVRNAINNRRKIDESLMNNINTLDDK